MQEVLPAERAAQRCVDGKTLRAVSAVASALGQRLGPAPWASASGKWPGKTSARNWARNWGAVSDLLTLLDLRGALVSLTTLSCPPHVAQQIIEQGGNYLLGLKANHPALLAEAERHTAALPAG